MTYDDSTHTSIRLVVRGQGHVPSFKNRKRAIRDSRTGKLRTLTEPKAARWMKACLESFVSQLHSRLAIIVTETGTARHQPYSTASLLPADDSLKHISELIVGVEYVPKGEEGAVIQITPL
jgi:F0F1-type ATP synthase gamma subunit